jgi:hypothetical protein
VKRTFEETDLNRIKPIPISGRKSKLTVDQIVDPKTAVGGGRPPGAGELLAVFPDILAADSMKRLVAAMKTARSDGRELLWLVGAHTIKCGLSLYLNALIDAGFITTISTTGSTTIHDLELAFFGKTSEFVEEELVVGRFGMARETAAHYSAACRHASESGQGLGAGMGDYIAERGAPHRNVSVFHKASERGIPATVHVSFGTDITHQHPSFPAERVGELTMKDFRIMTRRVERAFDHGVVIVFGSAVILPEVFLKAVSINYNLGHTPAGVTTASFDMLPQYRVRENVLGRPFRGAGESYAITGHHEIMLPLLYLLLEA